MGRLIYFEDHHPGQGRAAGPDWSPAAMKPERSRRSATGESLIPLQLALDEYDIEKCFAQLARFGRCSVIPRANPADAGKILFLVRIRDAIALNRHLLELEDDELLDELLDELDDEELDELDESQQPSPS